MGHLVHLQKLLVLLHHLNELVQDLYASLNSLLRAWVVRNHLEHPREEFVVAQALLHHLDCRVSHQGIKGLWHGKLVFVEVFLQELGSKWSFNLANYAFVADFCNVVEVDRLNSLNNSLLFFFRKQISERAEERLVELLREHEFKNLMVSKE